MNSGLLILSIITYILSLAAALILAIASAKLGNSALKKAILLHFAILAIAIPALILYGQESATAYLVLTAICSGLAISGWVLRSRQIKTSLKIYFGIYLFSVILFLISPSFLFFAISGNARQHRAEKTFRLGDNYYLVEQLSTSPQAQPAWKVIRKYGIYNKTILRDIRFKSAPDSVRMITVTEDTLILKSFYSSSTATDSMETGYHPNLKQNSITQHN